MGAGMECSVQKHPTRDNVINQVRCAGQSLINNAESMIGTEEFLTDFSISIKFSVSADNAYIPTIDISKSIIPDTYVDYIRNKVQERDFDK